QSLRGRVIRRQEGSSVVRFQGNSGCRPGRRYAVYADHHDDPAYPLLERSAVVIVERGSSTECAVRILAGKPPVEGDPLLSDGYVSANVANAAVYRVDADAGARPYAYTAVSMFSAADPEIDIWGLLNSTVFPKPDLTPVSRDVCNLRVTIE